MIRAAAAWLLASVALAPAPVVAAESSRYLPEQVIVNPAGQPVITPAQAKSLVKAVWEARYRALAIDDLETQAAAEFDNDVASLAEADV